MKYAVLVYVTLAALRKVKMDKAPYNKLVEFLDSSRKGLSVPNKFTSTKFKEPINLALVLDVCGLIPGLWALQAASAADLNENFLKDLSNSIAETNRPVGLPKPAFAYPKDPHTAFTPYLNAHMRLNQVANNSGFVSCAESFRKVSADSEVIMKVVQGFLLQ